MRDILLKEAVTHMSESAQQLSKMVTNSAFAQHLLEQAYMNGQFSSDPVLELEQVLEVSIGIVIEGVVTYHEFVSNLMAKFKMFEEALGENTAIGFLILFDPNIVDDESICQDSVEDITALFARYNLQRLNVQIMQSKNQN